MAVSSWLVNVLNKRTYCRFRVWRIYVLIPKINKRAILFQFQSRVIQRQISEILGATINQITNKDLASFTIVLPSSEIEQTTTILSDMDTEFQTLQERLTKIRRIKQSMMQGLLTGKTRLVQPAPKESANVWGKRDNHLYQSALF